MILPDTSAWVEFLRGTGSPVNRYLRRLLEENAPLLTTEVIAMEVLAGARDDVHLDRLRRLLLRCEFAPVGGLTTYEEAAELYRRCRRSGVTIRRLTDCLIAAVALRVGADILHADSDFIALGRLSNLALVDTQQQG